MPVALAKVAERASGERMPNAPQIEVHAALASYARQSQDETLLRHAMKIQSRATKRCGELLQQIVPSKGGRPKETEADAGDGVDFQCRTCHEIFFSQVRHCRYCAHHYPDTECRNCHRAMPRGIGSDPVLKTSAGADTSSLPSLVEPTRKQAAEDAGISKRQAVTALRVASIPEDQFEALSESPAGPPTVMD